MLANTNVTIMIKGNQSMVTEMTVHAAANVFELIALIFVVLQTTLFLDSWLVTQMYDPLRSCA